MDSTGRGWNESRIHRWLLKTLRPRGLAAEYGHDAATLSRVLRRPVVCVDQCIEGVHYLQGTSARLVGAKAAARALSDLAASAAQPRALLLSASFPPTAREPWIRAAILAVARAAREVDAELVGGDLACSVGPAVLAVTALGELGPGARAPSRDQVRAGDILFSTGPLGGSFLGRHLKIEPRLGAGRWLWQQGARAMTDLSDGLARDVARLAARSGVGIDIEHVPIHRDSRRASRRSGQSALEHALYDGEDHELVVALEPTLARRLAARSKIHAPGLTRIGRAYAGRGVRAPRSEDSESLQALDPRRGWNHGQP